MYTPADIATSGNLSNSFLCKVFQILNHNDKQLIDVNEILPVLLLCQVFEMLYENNK